jgi:nudix-type nucleoside diphosphatase (YffH/AdpP family)
LPGELRDPDLRALVLGRRAPLRPALVRGYSVKAAAPGGFAVAVPEAGAIAEGLLLDAPAPEDIARLDWYAVSLGQERRCADAEVDGERLVVDIHAPPEGTGAPAAAWRLDTWQARHRPRALLAAPGVMALRGSVPPGRAAHLRPVIEGRAAARLRAADAPAPAVHRSARGAGEVTVRASEDRHLGFFELRELELSHPRFDGTRSPWLRREVFCAGDAVIVLPFDPRRDRILLVEQFRMGPFARGASRPWMLEPVAGFVDAGETPEDAARREAQEEARLALGALLPVASYYPSPGASTEYFHSYLALCDLPDLEERSGGLASEHEDIRLHLLSFSEAMALVESGEAEVGPLITALLWLERERPRLRAEAGAG